MRLKSVRLAGFKSFVDPTTVWLSTNLTAVVGPNGCGKSNVIDAVRWVMGESSARHLRGESMADVIFNGSTERKPVAQASIELLFDNSDGALGGEYAAYAEISIRRLVTRDGRSDYFLNGSRCRRKDITDIFLGTGLGPRSYAIIEQGMISRLIEARPEELRVYIEEAAGISRYRERRRETETRMRHTRENLDRLQDVRSELERQLQHLERQAAAAEKFRQYKNEELGLRADLLALRWQHYEKIRRSTAQTLQEQEVELAAQAAAWQRAETQWELTQETRRQQAQQHQEAQQEFYRAGAELNRIEQWRAHYTERQQRLLSDKDEVMQQRQQAQQADDHDAEAVAVAQRELRRLAPELERLAAAVVQAQEAQDAAEQAMQEWQTAWEQFYARMALHRQQAQVQQSLLQSLEQSQKRNQERLQRLVQEQDLLQVSQQEEELLVLDARIEQLQDDQQGTEIALQETQQQLVQLRQEQQHWRRQQEALQLLWRQEQGRLSALEALQQAAAGQNTALVQWLKQQGWEHHPRLSAALQVTPEWMLAVEVVLGYRLQALTQGRWDQGAPEHLPPSTCCVLEIDSTHEIERSLPADALVHQVRPVAVHPWLANARCVVSLAEACQRRQELLGDEFWVTPQGILLGPHWIQWPGQADPSMGVLERQQTLCALREHTALLQEQLRTQEEASGRLQQRQTQLEQQEAVQRQQQAELARQKSLKLAERSGKLVRREQGVARQQRIGQDIAEVEMQRQEDRERYASVRLELDQALEAMQLDAEQQFHWQEKKEENRQSLEHCRVALRRHQEAKQQAERQQQQAEGHGEAAQRALERSQQALLLVQQRWERLQRQEQELAAEAVPGEVEVQHHLQWRLQAEQTLHAVQDALAVLEQQLQTLERQRHHAAQQRDRLSELVAAGKLIGQDAQSRQDTLTEQLRELGQTLPERLGQLDSAASETLWQERLEKVQGRLQRLGSVNLAAIEEFAAQQQRKVWLDAQYNDLEQALTTLEQAIRTIDRETRTLFRDTFDRVNGGFRALFPKVFGGGEAWLELTGDEVLEAGVSIMARPPGKRNSTIHLLSGGEKALTALSLVFSIFALNPAPFCMLDEVDAPLDDANVGRFARLVEEMSQQVQFIYITHNRIAMEMARQLMGVTMQEPGVSRLVSVDLEEAARLAAVG